MNRIRFKKRRKVNNGKIPKRNSKQQDFLINHLSSVFLLLPNNMLIMYRVFQKISGQVGPAKQKR
jgi:hypothetical protein